jgi:hypothetical protein
MEIVIIKLTDTEGDGNGARRQIYSKTIIKNPFRFGHSYKLRS